MRYLGIDFGTKRIGIAVSDPEGKIAFPYSVLSFVDFEGFLKELEHIIEKEHIKSIVVGLPLGMQQQDTSQTQLTRNAIDRIKAAFSIPVYSHNELLSSKLAERMQPGGAKNDASAAALILQSFLYSHEV